MTTESRPMTLGELLDRTFSYYRQRFWTFVGIMAIPQVFLLAASLLDDAFWTPGLARWGTTAASGKVMLDAGLGMLVMLVAYCVGDGAALGATTWVVWELRQGHELGIASGYRTIFRRVDGLFRLVISIVIRVLGSFILVVIASTFVESAIRGAIGPDMVLRVIFPVLSIVAGATLALMLAVRYCLAIPALLIENLGARAAIRRSGTLTRGYRGRLVVVALATLIVGLAIGLLLQMPFTIAMAALAAKHQQASLSLLSAARMAQAVTGALTGPLLMIGLALAYFDVRVRKEAFDLELMMASMGSNPLPPVPAGLPPANSPAANS